MKSTFKLVTLLGLAAVALAPLARAEDQPATPPTPDAPATPPPGQPGGPGQHGHRGGMRGDHLKMLSEKLNLTDAQRTQVKAILSAAEPQMKALRDNESLSEEDRRTQFQAMRKSTHDQIRALLTPEQQATFDAMPPPGRPGHKGPPPGDGDAPPVPKPQ